MVGVVYDEYEGGYFKRRGMKILTHEFVVHPQGQDHGKLSVGTVVNIPKEFVGKTVRLCMEEVKK